MQTLLELVKISRPGFYPTHVWFYVLPFAQRYMFDSVPFWLGGIYVCFPMGLLIYGWNDIHDVVSDSANQRKGNWLFGARPDAAMRRRLPWIMAIVQVPFVLAFVVYGGPRMLGWFAAVLAANWLYNNVGFKQLPGLDLLNQIGYLLVFVLASWLCEVDQLNLPAMLFSALFAMQSHLFGQLMDLDEDRLAGRRTTAVTLGVRPGKLLLASLMAIEAGIALTCFRGMIVGVLMTGGSLFFLIDAIFGPRRYPLRFVTGFFIAWNLVVIATIHFIWQYGVFQLK